MSSLVLGHEETYFVKENSDSKNKYSENDIIKMLKFVVDTIVVSSWHHFRGFYQKGLLIDIKWVFQWAQSAPLC